MSNTFSGFIWEHRITYTMINNIENQIENLRLQEWSLKNRTFWMSVISLEISFFNVNAFLM